MKNERNNKTVERVIRSNGTLFRIKVTYDEKQSSRKIKNCIESSILKKLYKRIDTTSEN